MVNNTVNKTEFIQLFCHRRLQYLVKEPFLKDVQSKGGGGEQGGVIHQNEIVKYYCK